MASHDEEVVSYSSKEAQLKMPAPFSERVIETSIWASHAKLACANRRRHARLRD
jgi:hypothetical protein